MSEFKFACPICGQHMTADSKDTGSQVPCPTCYRKIVVPAAPATDDPKFVLSASEANKPRPPQAAIPEGYLRGPEKSAFPPAVLIAVLVLACGAGATVFALRGKIFNSQKPPVADNPGNNGEDSKPDSPPQPEFAGTSLWNLDLSDAKFPETDASGSIHGRAFTLEHASLTGSNLTLRVGRSGSVDLGLNIYFFNRQPEELAGKTAEIKPSDTTAPRITLRWKDEKKESKTFHSGYAMKVEFGTPENGVLPGKIFVSLPDDSKSWIAGTFRAEMHKPGPPKPKAPAPMRIPQTQ
jgi:hypothetical protein